MINGVIILYTILTGARLNVGDYLIGARAKELLAEERHDREIVELSRFHLSEESLIQNSKKSNAIILGGGPAYSSDIFPRIYPIVSYLPKINVPIIPFGLGWSGVPMNNPNNFTFSDTSLEILNKIHNNCEYTSCRDKITEGILKRHGFNNVLMTGCPAMYDLNSIGRKFVVPKELNKIVFTPPQKKIYHKQCILLMEKIRGLFPKAELYCVFHRNVFSTIKGKAKKLNYHIVEAAKDLSKIEFYRNCDLHIGYRVHAHLFFLSIRKPSFLIHEDGRGIGQSNTLQLSKDIAGTEDQVAIKMIQNIKNEVSNGFDSFIEIGERIDSNYNTMRKFLKSLP